MDGMRYKRGGQSKYWVPKPQKPDSRTPLLAGASDRAPAPEARGHAHDYRAASPDKELEIDPEDERLFTNARALEFGDWNYPVITAHEATREDWLHRDPGLLTTSTNRNLFQPTKDHKTRRRTEIREGIAKGKDRSNSRPAKEQGAIENKLQREQSSGSSSTQHLTSSSTSWLKTPRPKKRIECGPGKKAATSGTAKNRNTSYGRTAPEACTKATRSAKASTRAKSKLPIPRLSTQSVKMKMIIMDLIMAHSMRRVRCGTLPAGMANLHCFLICSVRAFRYVYI